MRVLFSFFTIFGAVLLAGFNVPQVNAQTGSFTFGAAGDFGTGAEFQATVNAAGTNNLNFFLTLGDHSYASGSEQSWCSTFKAKVTNVIVLAGNHDTGESSGGDINVYRQHCPFTLGTPNGDYGKQYYFDYPQTSPLARFIMIVPGVSGSTNISYANGGAGYTYVSSAIDDARAKGIKWIFVGMHKNYISAMVKPNELGSDLIPLLMSKKVDVILQAHEHGYERSKQLTCARAGAYDAACVVDSDTSMIKGAGSIIHVLGTGGKTLRGLNTGDTEYAYFASADNTTYGFGKFTVSPTQLSFNFVRSAGGNFTDAFTISGSGQTPPGTVSPPFGGIITCPGNPGCPSPGPSPVISGGQSNPSNGPIAPSTGINNPNPSTTPCGATGASLAGKKDKSKHWNHKGGVSGIMEALLRFFIELINMLLKLFGGGQINIPNQGNPVPTNPQQQPSQVVPQPCVPIAEPINSQAPEPSQINTQPSISIAPSQGQTPSTTPLGSILWQDAPASPVGTSHPFQNWDNAPWNIYGGSTVTVVADPVKGKAIRFFGPANGSNGDNQRGEIVPGFKFKGGENVWLGFDLWVDSPLSMARAHQHLWQFKSAPSEGSPTFVVNINNHKEGLVTENDGPLFAPTPYNKWIRMVYGINATKNGSSSIEIWVDGKQVSPRKTQAALLRAGDTEGYLKFGVYRAPKPYDMSMRMANFKIGTTKEIVSQ